MIRFAAMLEVLAQDGAAEDYLREVGADEGRVADALLSGRRPRRIVGLAAMLAWAGEVAGLPDWLMDASLAVSGDRAEVAALVLPPPVGEPPTLAEVIAALQRCTPITAHATLVALWARLPPEAALVLNRLASGTFRARWPVLAAQAVGPRRSLKAVMVQARGARGEVTLALRSGDGLVPLPPVALTLPETPEIMAWVRESAAQRFGPVQVVAPRHLFQLEFDGLLANKRRKCGFDLINPAIVAWLPDRGAEADGVEVLGGDPALNKGGLRP